MRHVGTQYEVRLLDSSVQVSVRDGTIEWRSSRGDVERSGSGEQLTISNDGRVERTSVPAYGAAWDWTLEAAPTIDIEGLPLAQFLAWAARETGREDRVRLAGRPRPRPRASWSTARLPA